MRTARSRTSAENLFDLFIAPFSQELEPPPNPGRFNLDRHRLARWPSLRRIYGYCDRHLCHPARPASYGDSLSRFGRSGGCRSIPVLHDGLAERPACVGRFAWRGQHRDSGDRRRFSVFERVLGVGFLSGISRRVRPGNHRAYDCNYRERACTGCPGGLRARRVRFSPCSITWSCTRVAQAAPQTGCRDDRDLDRFASCAANDQHRPCVAKPQHRSLVRLALPDASRLPLAIPNQARSPLLSGSDFRDYLFKMKRSFNPGSLSLHAGSH